MMIRNVVLAVALTALVSRAPDLLSEKAGAAHDSHVVDTVYVVSPPDYDELARHVATRLASTASPTVINGDLIVKGRVGIGGAPEQNTEYALTIHGNGTSAMRLISNEALQDPQRTANQHRHVGTVSLAQDGGLRLDVNSTCYTDARGCTTEDRSRRRAYTGYDSMGDWSMYLSDVDSAGNTTAPRAQSLVFSLIGDDGHIHINAYRATQKIYFNGSTATNAADLRWEVPLAPIPPIQ
jgi:hypothetical protein